MTDLCLCDTTITIVGKEPDTLLSASMSMESASCNGLFDGSASVLGAGGNGVYSYLWSDGQTTSTASNLTAGTYNVTITDQKGCFKDTSVTVLYPQVAFAATTIQEIVSGNGLFE